MGYGHRNIAAKQQYHALLCCTQTGEVSNQSDCMISAAVIGDIRFFKKKLTVTRQTRLCLPDNTPPGT